MTDKAKILEASDKHAKPADRQFQYGTAGVSSQFSNRGIMKIVLTPAISFA